MILERPISKQAIEAYRELVDEMNFGWIPIYLKRQKIKREIPEIQVKLSTLQKLSPGNEDLRANAHSGLKVLEAESVKRLAAYLNENRRAQNPFSRIDRMKDVLANFLITPEMIDSAVDSLPERKDCISIDQKQKDKTKLEKALEKKKSELEKCSPPEHFQWINGRPTMDLCDNFEKKWRSIQGRLNQPCNALGFQLAVCSESEQQAWRDLGIRSAISPNSRNSPIPG